MIHICECSPQCCHPGKSWIFGVASDLAFSKVLNSKGSIFHPRKCTRPPPLGLMITMNFPVGAEASEPATSAPPPAANISAAPPFRTESGVGERDRAEGGWEGDYIAVRKCLRPYGVTRRPVPRITRLIHFCTHLLLSPGHCAATGARESVPT